MSLLATILNALALLLALGGCLLLLLLGSVFLRGDPGDRLLGWLIPALGMPLLLAGPLIGGWLLRSEPASWKLPVSCGIGGLWLGFGLLAAWQLPALLEAAVRP